MLNTKIHSKNTKKIFGEVFTPMSLCREMLNKLPEDVWKNPNYKWLDPACGSGNFLVAVKNRLMRSLKNVFPNKEEREKHILKNMLFGIDIQPKNIMLCFLRLDPDRKYGLEKHIVCANSLEYDYWNGTKFDIVMGNPPYNASGNTSTGNTLYDKFVNIALDRLLSKDGYLCYIHPSSWRKPDPKTNLWNKMSSKQILYLEIHNIKDGHRIFGTNIGTRYDWYILKNAPCITKTRIIDEQGKKHNINLQEWPWLPNYAFEKIMKIMAQKNENTCPILYSRTAYGSDKKTVSHNRDKEFRYPCVNSTAKTKGTIFYWAKYNDKGFFGIPKIIFCQSGSIVPILDLNGDYAMTENAMAIPITDRQEAEKMIAALSSSEFDIIIKATKWGNFRIDWRMFKYFKKDFWKEFIKEEKDINNK